MGAGLALAAYRAADSFKVEHAPTRLFVYMAVRAFDSDERPVFWGGRDALANALGNQDAKGHRAVTRAMATLAGVGLIETRPAAPGRNAHHFLRDGCGKPLRVVENEGRSPSPVELTKDAHRPPNEGRSADKRRTLSGQTKDAHRPPEEEEEEKEEGARPSRFCPQHPRGTQASCGPCRDARITAQEWKPARRTAPPHVHRFEPTSGYCQGCGVREDAA